MRGLNVIVDDPTGDVLNACFSPLSFSRTDVIGVNVVLRPRDNDVMFVRIGR